MPMPPLPLARLAAQAATFEAAKVKRRIKRNALGFGLIALFALFAIVFVLAAAYAALAAEIGPVWAALAIAGTFVLLAAATGAAMRIAAARERRRAATKAEARATIAANAAITLLPMLPTLFRSRAALVSILPIVAVGYLLLSRRDTAGDDPPQTFD